MKDIKKTTNTGSEKDVPLDILGIMSMARYTDQLRYFFKEKFRIIHPVNYNMRSRQLRTIRDLNK